MITHDELEDIQRVLYAFNQLTRLRNVSLGDVDIIDSHGETIGKATYDVPVAAYVFVPKANHDG